MIAIGWSSIAVAGTWKVCAKVVTDFAGVPDAESWEDYLTDDGPYPLRGVLLRVKKNGQAWQTAWADDAGDDVGCATFTINTSGNHTIRVESTALVDGHLLRVWQSDTNQTTVATDLTTTWSLPSGGGSGEWPVTLNVGSSGDNEWNILTSAAWALHHRDGGLPDQVWTMYDQACPTNPDSSCYHANALYMASRTRSVHLHELGHYLFHRYVGSGSNQDTSSPHTDECFYGNLEPNHGMQQKEWQSAAFHEGFANFYGMVSVNRETDSDCSFVYYRAQDYDLDGDEEDRVMLEARHVDDPWHRPIDDIRGSTRRCAAR